MKTFHTLLTSLTQAQRSPQAIPLSPRKVLEAWNQPSAHKGPEGENGYTIWGAFLANQQLAQGENPVIWSSVNTSHFDRTKRLFREDQDFRNWFPVLDADKKHVNRVHDVSRYSDAREKFLAASFLAEDFERAKAKAYRGFPWLLAKDQPEFRSEKAVTISLQQAGPQVQVVLRKPGDAKQTPLNDILLPADQDDLLPRFTRYLDQIFMRNPVDSDRTASCLLRVPAGEITQDYHLIEFYHTFSKPPSDALISKIIEATEIASSAIQSVMAPAIILAVETVRLGAVFSDVVGHDIDNWRKSIDASAGNLRASLRKMRLSDSARRKIEDDLDLIDFDNAVFKAVRQGFSRIGSRTRPHDREPIELQATIDWIKGLRHPSFKEGALLLEITGEPNQKKIPWEVNLVVANLIRNAVNANCMDDSGNIRRTEIKVTVEVLLSSVRIAVASKKSFNVSSWLKPVPDETCPHEHRGLWLSQQMLIPLGSKLLDQGHPDFGCLIHFSVAIS